VDLKGNCGPCSFKDFMNWSVWKGLNLGASAEADL
jgi:hypothetical protein